MVWSLVVALRGVLGVSIGRALLPVSRLCLVLLALLVGVVVAALLVLRAVWFSALCFQVSQPAVSGEHLR